MKRTLGFALYALHTHVGRKAILYSVCGIVLLIAIGAYVLCISAPSRFPANHFIAVRSDVPVSVIADELQSMQVIRSSFLFSAWMRLTGGDRSVNAGRYLFAKPLSLFEVASRIERGDTGIESIRVTLTEGMTVLEMSETLASVLPDFDTDTFLALARPQEGYLFPDTYFIEPGTPVAEITERLRTTFDMRTAELRTTLGNQDLADIVTMASLVEKETDTAADRRIVAGILWNRIRKDMPLQVDAVFGYVHDASGYTPTKDDLESDSPYNTYRVRGLPPTPIANPGLDALEAALNPTDTPYLYYLTGRDGHMHYARTFEEHKQNRALYLD